MKTSLVKTTLIALILSSTSVAMGFAKRLPSSDTTPVPVPAPASGGFVASWEKTDKTRAAWSNTIRQVVETKANALFKGPADVEQYCPMYNRLGTQDKLNFWVEFFAGVSLYESGWNPTSRMTETTMGLDAITGKQVASEGLLQLSYQDIQWSPYCQFNYAADKNYALNDPRRTILNPAINLSCGIQILDHQVQTYGSIDMSKNVYWATLKIGGKYTQIPQIQARTRALSFCKN